jgi:5,5'-dehydrodivanillate O-demethylase
MDDTHTLHFWYFGTPRAPEAAPQTRIPVYDNPFRHDDGALVVETVNGQDMMVWVTQGDVSDRTTERLGTSDRGVILLRELLEEQIRRVDTGQDPLGVLRDPARNEPMIELNRETRGFFVPTGGMMAIQTDDPLELFRIQKKSV